MDSITASALIVWCLISITSAICLLIGIWIGFGMGKKLSIGTIMKLEEIPRNTRLQFRGLVGTAEGVYFLFGEYFQASDGVQQLCLESRIARSPGGDQLNTLQYGGQFMVVENKMVTGRVAIEFMKLIE